MHKVILTLVLILTWGTSAFGGDLYRVEVKSKADAELLARIGVDPILAVPEGYLVLVGQPAEGQPVGNPLFASGLQVELIASDIARDQMALDGRLDRRNVEQATLLFEQDNLRLFRLEPDANLADKSGKGLQLFPIGDRAPVISYPDLVRPLPGETSAMVDLQTLISEVVTDSLASYVGQLQAFDGRVTGTPTNQAARNWISSKFIEFGYDSVFQDNFFASIYGDYTVCKNVVATKIGSRFPDHHVIIGAHFDAVPGSPGADDNGSGTAGVLELARILFDQPTEMTLIFMAFDGEEQGLHGSHYYADRAFAEGEEIVYMLNLDMIGHFENTTQASLYYGADRIYAELWQHMADSLVSISGVLAGASAGSDHHPFAQKGYRVTFVAERIFSTVYHSPQDSTTYMDFDYMTKLVQASAATAYFVSETQGPVPALALEYLLAPSIMLTPGQPATVRVEAASLWDGVPQPGTAYLYYSVDGGSYNSSPMVEVMASVYEANLPPLGCDSRVNYYVSIDEAGGETFYSSPPSAPRSSLVATGMVPLLADDFESDQGWTVGGWVSDGMWERAIPSNGGTRGDPPSDFDGSGFCFVTDNGVNADIDGGLTVLFSPVIDLSGGDAFVSFATWYSNSAGDDPYNDVMYVRVSNDGGSYWHDVLTIGPIEEANGGWFEHSFWVSDFLQPNATVQIHFEAADRDAGSVVEAAIDAVRFETFVCTETPLTIATQSLPDADLGEPYQAQLEAINGVGQVSWLDLSGGLVGTGLVLSTIGLLSGQPQFSGVVDFTAEVNDDSGFPAESLFSLSIVTCCIGTVGNANNEGDDIPTIGDIAALVDYLFISRLEPACAHEADADQSGGASPTLGPTGDITIADVATLVDRLFITGPSRTLAPCL